MTERTWSFMDGKHLWGDGPWVNEPDKIQWIDAATDLDCLIVRNHHGALCGYVGLAPGHPRYGQAKADYDDLDVHGEVTYAALCQEHGHVCHVPEPGRPADVWWVGFDCAHTFDVVPAFEALHGGMPSIAGLPPETYKTVDYVRAEVTALAQQLRT